VVVERYWRSSRWTPASTSEIARIDTLAEMVRRVRASSSRLDLDSAGNKSERFAAYAGLML
jgi:hypothetical protein